MGLAERMRQGKEAREKRFQEGLKQRQIQAAAARQKRMRAHNRVLNRVGAFDHPQHNTHSKINEQIKLLGKNRDYKRNGLLKPSKVKRSFLGRLFGRKPKKPKTKRFKSRANDC